MDKLFDQCVAKVQNIPIERWPRIPPIPHIEQMNDFIKLPENASITEIAVCLYAAQLACYKDVYFKPTRYYTPIDEPPKNCSFEFLFDDSSHDPIEIDIDLFDVVINKLSNKPSTGICKIHNNTIKQLTSVHRHLKRAYVEILQNPKCAPDWFFIGITTLVPKLNGGFRPITCMSNLYKLLTKIIAKNISSKIKLNQGGAKEQYMLNMALSKEYDYQLHMTWFDIKGAYNNVNHAYLIRVLQYFNIKVIPFIQEATQRWRLRVNQTEIRFRHGLIQGDNMSVILFMLCMEPISIFIQHKCPKLMIHGININHIIYMDDFKLFALQKHDLLISTYNTVSALKQLGFGFSKFHTNIPDFYYIDEIKYLGIYEMSNGRVSHPPNNHPYYIGITDSQHPNEYIIKQRLINKYQNRSDVKSAIILKYIK